jgi:rRNA maturation protein Nop10
MFSLSSKCPHCGRVEHFALRGVIEYIAKSRIVPGDISTSRTVKVDLREGHHTAKAYGAASCPNCGGPILIWFECPQESLALMKASSGSHEWRYNGSNPKILGVFPEGEKPDDSPHYPEALRKVFVELQEDVKMGRNAPRIVVGCRSVLEVALKDLGYTGKHQDLRDRIKKARADGRLTESMSAWAERIRLEGNEAAHELSATDAEAREFVDFLRLFLEIAFVLPARIEAAKKED